MGMHLRVVGHRTADETWNRQKAVWDACEAAGIRVPDEVLQFFDHVHPGDKPGMEAPIDGAMRALKEDGIDGYEVDLQALPAGIRYLRCYCSW